jgi:hypothetical protein
MAACQFIDVLMGVMFETDLQKGKSVFPKKMGWKNPPMQLSRETGIVSRKSSTGNTLRCQVHGGAAFSACRRAIGCPGANRPSHARIKG